MKLRASKKSIIFLSGVLAISVIAIGILLIANNEQLPASAILIKPAELETISTSNVSKVRKLGTLSSTLAFAFIPNEPRFIAEIFTQSGNVYIGNYATGEPAGVISTYEVRDLAISPDRNILALATAYGGKGNVIRLRDVPETQQEIILAGHEGLITDLAFSPDGQTLASGSFDNTIRLWDIQTQQPLGALEGHTDWINNVVFSSDGRTLASGGFDNTVRIWDVVTQQQIRILAAANAEPAAIAFHPFDDTTLIAAYEDGIIRFWSIPDGRIIKGLPGGEGVKIAFSPDGLLMASAISYDDPAVSPLRFWNLMTGDLLVEISNPTIGLGRYHDLEFSSDGKLLAVGAGLAGIQFWGVPIPDNHG